MDVVVEGSPLAASSPIYVTPIAFSGGSAPFIIRCERLSTFNRRELWGALNLVWQDYLKFRYPKTRYSLSGCSLDGQPPWLKQFIVLSTHIFWRS